jgi:OTU domain-containing protein 6
LNELTLEDQKPAVEKAAEPPKKKVNKAKLRLEKRNAEMERIRLEAEKEAENQVDMGAVETEEIRKLIVPMKLRIKQISADGHWYES